MPPQTLIDLFDSVPGSDTAIALPEEGVKVSYDSLRRQVTAVAHVLAPPAGAEEARRAAEGSVPVLTAALDSAGEVRLSGGGGGRTAPPPSPDEVALVLHTSGSTGRPQRVPLTHRNPAGA